MTSEIFDEDLKSVNIVSLTIGAVYQRDFLSVISEAYDGFLNFLNAKRKESESLKTSKTRFSAAVTKFNSLFETTKLLQYITALMLLSNSDVEHSQKVW